MILKIAGIAVLSALSFVLLKKDKAEFAFILELCSVVGLLVLILPFFESIIEYFSDISQHAGLGFDFVDILLKCSGIAIVARLISELCRDAGENALSVKIELAAKVLILMQALPVIRSLFELILTLTEKVL